MRPGGGVPDDRAFALLRAEHAERWRRDGARDVCSKRLRASADPLESMDRSSRGGERTGDGGGRAAASVQLEFDGDIVLPNQTPASLEMEDGDLVDVLAK